MENKYEMQVMTVGDFIAETLESEANRMPPSYKADADVLREQARLLRQRDSNLIRVWREVLPE
jgi:hypothetical protein